MGENLTGFLDKTEITSTKASDKAYFDTDRQFVELIQRHTVLFSEAMALEQGEDFFFLSDPETYEVYVLYTAQEEPANSDWKHFEGKTCYALFQGRSTPCPFCEKAHLAHDQDSIWEQHSGTIGRDFLMRCRLVYWGTHILQLGLALDITDPQRTRQILFDSVQQQNLLLHWVRTMTEVPLHQSFELILPELCDYFQAEFGAICSFTKQEIFKVYSTSERNVPFPLVSCPTKEVLEECSRFFIGDQQVIIKSVNSIKETEPDIYQLLYEKGLHSLCMTPVLSKGRLIGMVALGNMEKHQDVVFLQKALAACLATSIQRRVMQEENQRIQFVDSLTGYLNYEGFQKEVQRLLQQYPERNYSLWYSDVKKFKFINDVYGYDVGDRLLQYWSDCIARDAREEEAFCRVSADNFAALRWYDEYDELEERFIKSSQNLAQFPDLADKRFPVEMVSGIYLIEKTADMLSMGEMLNRANMAQKSVKMLPGSQLAYYTDEMRRKEIQELLLATEMEEAMQKERFVLYFQPQKCIQPTLEGIVRAEVLVRWKRDDGPLVMPAQFIDLFEKNGMIVELDYYMFEHSCRFMQNMLKRLEHPICLSVNVSRITMLQTGFAEKYRDLRIQYEIPENYIELEFTENGVVEDLEGFAKLIGTLQQYGFRCAMDDFGTGQSSLNTLQSLPLDVLKLDRNFFYGTQTSKRNQIIVSSILQMARLLGMHTVAEGIESKAQVVSLGQMGCDYIQGYVYSRPLPAAEFMRQLLEDQL